MRPAILLDRQLRRLAFAAWWLGWAVLLAVTWRPQPELPLALSDKAWHVLGFALMTATAAAFAHERHRLLGWSGVALAMGALVELGQMFVPSRAPDLLDLAADAVGVLLGLALALAWLAAVVAPLRRRLDPA